MAGQSLPKISRRIATIVLTAALTALFVAGADQLDRRLTMAFKRQSVADLAHNALTRAEIATDYAVIRLGMLYENGHTDCSPDAMEAINYAVFRSGTIKDILTAQGENVCSVAMHSETLLENHRHPVDTVQARNSSIALNPVRLDNTPAMAVTWLFEEDVLATALVNTESLVFDLLPADLRETSAIRLSLSNGRTVGRFTGAEWQIGGETEMFEAASERYPLRVRIHVPTAVLSQVPMNRSAGTIIVVGALAGLLAFLVARGLIPAPNAASRIRAALRRGEIVPNFQPVYAVRTGELTGFEVLARWPGETGPMASPAFFVPLIEANGWSDDLLETVILQTAQTMRSVIDNVPAVSFAFNASPAQLVEPGFAAWLERVLNRAELDARRVIIEITEREEIRDVEKARSSIEALKAMGIDVAIDDAGTGHNGLASVQRLGASILKIDKLFVDGIVQDERAGALVQMLVDVARQFGMKTIAEGVEDEIQLNALKRLGVDEVQGFFLCTPLAPEPATLELARHQAILTRNRLQARPPEDKAMPLDHDAGAVAVNA
ncbi:EAL domain-containing protein [Oricola thermophila]|uniref:cyclic-guanylate-specific phosphodiesterase n=1 Tax=Oricola thermophila TaxID=2742145 RepID=A0A6N1VDP0_9HYPH|nr:EAL domain-containing protein [Oricola thermophila]QKV17157.1 EAL domain-containing protein [Oricola thermophila]